MRPPPETSEYHAQNPLYEGVLDRLAAEAGVTTVVIPRTDAQASASRERGSRPRGDQGSSLVVPERAVDAQSLIAFADLVVSAGGTMNREAVALGTPVYTIFSGAMGAVDERLIADGRLRELASPDAIELSRSAGAGRAARAARPEAALRRRARGRLAESGTISGDESLETWDAILAFVFAGVGRLDARAGRRVDRAAHRRDGHARGSAACTTSRPRSWAASRSWSRCSAPARSGCPGTPRRARSSAAPR